MILKRIISYSFNLGLIVLLFGLVLNFMCFNKSFYRYEYSRLDTAASIGMSSKDLEKTTDVLLGYLKGDYEDLTISVKVNGESREVFNEREKAHMVDVLALYNGFQTIVRSCAIIVGLSLIAIFVLKIRVFDIKRSYTHCLMIFGGFLLAIIIFCLVDFNAFWTQFHHIFFTNDLWLLDPNTDILIQMVPGPFFNDLVLGIIILFGLSLALYYILLRILKGRDINV